MSQRVKSLVARPGDFSSVSRAQILKEKTNIYKLSSPPEERCGKNKHTS